MGFYQTPMDGQKEQKTGQMMLIYTDEQVTGANVE